MWSMMAPAGSLALPAPPSAPSISAANAEMPGVSLRSPASASAYSWLGPPRPLPRTVTVSSPPDRIATRLPAAGGGVDLEAVFRDDGARIRKRARIRHRRSRRDRGWIVVRNVRDRQRD